MPNWRIPGDYDFINKYRPELIAWEFLRRNPDYQHDYRWFISLWSELEAQYGAPPNRDFESWKKDPRASRSESEIYNLHKTSSADDNLLIECWMGTKWGFYKFPINPDNTNPVLGKELSWRSNPNTVDLITNNALSDLTTLNLDNKAAIIFNLQKGLKEQIQSARQQLIIAQKNNSSADENKRHWILSLRLLDAIITNVSDTEIQNTLALSKQHYLKLKSQAKNLIREHYLEILNII